MARSNHAAPLGVFKNRGMTVRGSQRLERRILADKLHTLTDYTTLIKYESVGSGLPRVSKAAT